MKVFRVLIPVLLTVCSCGVAHADGLSTFDDLSLSLGSYWNGPDPSGTDVPGQYGDTVRMGSFGSAGVEFVNKYSLDYGSWAGFAYSNTTDTTTPGYLNQFSAVTGVGHDGSANYGVAFGYRDVTPTNLPGSTIFDPSNINDLRGLPYFTLPTGATAEGMYVTNTTYAALSMMQGDGFAKKFGGDFGNDPDWSKLTAYGTDAAGNVLSAHVDFYLADFRFDDNSQDYIVQDWRYMDLSALDGAETLYFNVSSSDAGQFGLNTPAYFAMDDLSFSTVPTPEAPAVPEPSGLALGIVGLGAIAFAARRRRKKPERKLAP